MPDENDFDLVQEDDDDYADEEDKEFLKEAIQPKPKPQAQIARQNSQASKQSAKREQQWAGNGLGSGQLSV